ncbi:MAG: hypothetical protein ACKOYJ_11075 [Planctomycetia bacterium]
MDHRLGRTARVFLVVLAAAGFYRLAVVPWVEPRVSDSGTSVALTPEQAAMIRARADRRLAALGDIFPEGAWERDDPIVLESRQMRLLFKQYQSLPDGRVNLVPCTLVVLPDRNRVAEGGASGRTIVLRAPQGAVLEFDEPIDLRQGRLAKLVGGSLRGQVMIRGTPTAPGAEDDIEIVTRDVELAELEVRTNEAVQFRHGRSTGSGRALVATLMPRPGPSEHGPNIGGVDTIRIDRDVRMRLEGFSSGILPGPARPGGEENPPQPAPPVLVSCAGPLCMNVSASVITLEERVEVLRHLPDGGLDQLSCDLLAIVLGNEQGKGGGRLRGSVEPVEIQASGTPVVARSTGARLEARGGRLGYEIATRRILIDGEESVSLIIQGSQMEARSIDYTPGPPGDPGTLKAKGPGWLRTKPEKGAESQARWEKWLRMWPEDTGHRVSLSGEAEVAVESQGRLTASEMYLWLDVVPRANPDPASRAPMADLSGIRPTRMLAHGTVQIDSEQLAARTERMELWFKSTGAEATPDDTKPAPAAGANRATTNVVSRSTPSPSPTSAPSPADRPLRGRLVATGGLVRGLVTLDPRGNQVEEISMEEQVRLIEENGGNEAGLDIRGDQAQVTRATRFDARAIVSGRPARITGRGVDLEGPLITFDRGLNRMTVDGAGRLQMPMSGGMNGLESLAVANAVDARAAAPASPGSLDVAWKGRMDFDGLTARFVDRVVTSSGGTSLKAGSLDVILAQPIDFSDPAKQRGQRSEVARIACGSGVRIESQSTGEDGSKSMEQLFVRDLVLDRASGGFTGTGPGRLTSTRHGQPPALPVPATGAAGGPPQPAAPRPDGLTYLGVDFQRGMRGNINHRVMEFHQRVEAIWGPVATWGETLDPHAAGGLPPRAVSISGDTLTVGQSPTSPGQRRTSIELAAGGNVLVEGESFTARSARLAWSEAKDLLVFEGDGRSDAQLFRQVRVGAPMSSASAGKILYWRSLNRVDVEDARYLDFDQITSGGKGMGVPGMGSVPQQRLQQPVPGT